MLIIQRPKVEAIGEQEGNRQKFSIAPLEPGFGHTMGNSLRRILLSSIPGAAVTQVRFDDSLHEFDTLEGVTEDVTDIILNLKDVILVMRSEDPVTLRLDVRGPRDVVAGDIQTTSDVEILNPEVRIATLSDKGHLAVDLTVSTGRGYVSADGNRSVDDPIGVIPIDSIFSPVRRVACVVEPTRVEQSTHFDALVVDVETDGSITPREAVASAGATLRKLMQLVEEMSDEPRGLEIGEVVAETSSPDLEIPIEDLDLSERPRNCLKRAQVNTVGELLIKSEDDLLAITNFGQKSLDEVIEKLDERGLSLRNPD